MAKNNVFLSIQSQSFQRSSIDLLLIWDFGLITCVHVVSVLMGDADFLSELETVRDAASKNKVLNRISVFREFDPLFVDKIPVATRRESYRRFIRERLACFHSHVSDRCRC